MKKRGRPWGLPLLYTGVDEGQPLETSHGEDLYRQIFDLNELHQHRPSDDAALAIGATDRDQVKP
jgi:hypothetical protein